MKRFFLFLVIVLALLCSCSQHVNSINHDIPWQRNVVKEAVQSQTINYYFMSSCGMVMDETNKKAPRKWGDSCLVVLPDGTTILIDAAMHQYAKILKENLHRLGVDHLDYLILSHPHIDHASGIYDKANTILKEFEVGHFYCNGVYNANWSDAHQLEKILDKYGVPYSCLCEGDVFDIGSVHFSVINPPKEQVGTTIDQTPEVNNSSMVLRMDYGEFSALFTGDIYAEKEQELVLQYPDVLDVDLLKIPHHGYQTSSTVDFANATSPVVAVATGYVLMASNAFEAYQAADAKVLFDYLDGYIHVWSDDQENIRWETSHGRTMLNLKRYGSIERQ